MTQIVFIKIMNPSENLRHRSDLSPYLFHFTKDNGGRRVRGEVNHLYTIKKWHAKQESIQIAEYITPTAHLMNSSPTRSINIFKTETNQGSVT